MSVSGLKAELKFLESIFDKDHERFRIVSWKLDELHCQFVLLPPPPGSSPQPPPPLTIHCNITVRGPRGAGRAGHGGPGTARPRHCPRGAGRGRTPPGDSARGGAGGLRGRSPGAPGALPAATVTKVTGGGRPRPLLLRGGGSSGGPGHAGRTRGRGRRRFGAGSREPEQRAARPGHRAGTEPRGERRAPRPGPAPRWFGGTGRVCPEPAAGALPSAPHGRGLGRGRGDGKLVRVAVVGG